MKVADHAIITCLDKSAQHLPELVASMAAQTLKPLQWIIVDDSGEHGSTLKTLLASHQAALQQTEIEIVAPNQPLGLGRACNRALAQVRSERVSMMHAGDSLRPQFLERMKVLSKKYEPDLTLFGYCNANLRLPRPDRVRQLATPLEPGLFLLRDPLALLGEGQFLLQLDSNIVYRTAFLQDLRFDEHNSGYGALDLWFRSVRNGMARGPCRCLLETGDFIRRDPQTGKAAHGPEHWQEPVQFVQWLSGEDMHERQLAELVLSHWLPDTLKKIPGRCAKLCFLSRRLPALQHYWSVRLHRRGLHGN